MKKILFYILGGTFGLFLSLPMSAMAPVAHPAPSATAKVKQRTITKVETIQVETPVGTAPRLPWQVWVTYSDGSHEWRQTKWTNFQLSTEQEEANPELYPVGKSYSVNGFIIGDNTTEDGYPITASVKVVDKAWAVPNHQPVAQPLPLGNVTITGNNRLTNNRDLDIRTILSWDVAQLLYNYRDTYGLTTEGYPEAFPSGSYSK